jgi:hypothetical protein
MCFRFEANIVLHDLHDLNYNYKITITLTISQEADMNKFINFVAGATLGALVGATTALLLAPISGEEFQMQIKDQVEQIQLEVKTAASERRAELEEQLSTLREPRPAA